MPARTSPTLLPPSPRTVLSLSCFKVLQCINCRDWHCKRYHVCLSLKQAMLLVGQVTLDDSCLPGKLLVGQVTLDDCCLPGKLLVGQVTLDDCCLSGKLLVGQVTLDDSCLPSKLFQHLTVLSATFLRSWIIELYVITYRILYVVDLLKGNCFIWSPCFFSSPLISWHLHQVFSCLLVLCPV